MIGRHGASIAHAFGHPSMPDRPILWGSLVMTTEIAFNSSRVSLICFQVEANSLSKLIQQPRGCKKYLRKSRRRHDGKRRIDSF